MDYLSQLQRTNKILQSVGNNPTQPQSNSTKEIYEELMAQKNFFERLNEIQKQKILQLEQELARTNQNLSKVIEFVDRYKDKMNVAAAREQAYQLNNQSKPALDRPIDRTGVAPKDVQIEKIFNFANKRF